jgi:Mce-associated membrane protein
MTSDDEPDVEAGDEHADDAPDGEPAAEPRWPNLLLAGAAALVVVAVAVAGWFAVAWIRAGNDDDLGRAKLRDDVDRIARSAIVTFHTLDYRKVNEGLDGWQNASTGPLHADVVGRRESSRKAIEAARTVTEGKVLSLAVTELNDFDGKATVIAAVKVHVAPEGKPAEDKYLRIQAIMQRTDGGWKLSGLGQVDIARAG